MFPTRHAVQRYQQRVMPVSTREAFRALETAAASARRRATPRWWTPVEPAPGLLFLYPPAMPGVCLLCRDGVILTVFERGTCRGWHAAEAQIEPMRARPTAYHRPSAGSLILEAA